MPRILVVDNDQANLQIMRMGLKHAGFSVLTARTGKRGIEMAQEAQPDLILLDIMMPTMDGAKAAELLKKDPGTCKIPICFLTAMHMKESEKAEAYEIGVDAVITKPYEHAELVSEIRQVLANKPA